ncbi:MAG: hypothetical protein HS126_35010 [Anaerolineales bacterium]|nr:hypothetical protein [Anaerolineales bacterium]
MSHLAGGVLLADTLHGPVNFDHWVQQPARAAVAAGQLTWNWTVPAKGRLPWWHALLCAQSPKRRGNLVEPVQQRLQAPPGGLFAAREARRTLKEANIGAAR